MEQWQKLLGEFPENDIYSSLEYFVVSNLLEKGEITLFYMRNENGHVFYPFIKKEIPIQQNSFGNLYDITTPYGYGGPLIKVIDNRELLLEEFQNQFNNFCMNEGIVSEFIRFHTLIANHQQNRKDVQLDLIRETIYIDLEKISLMGLQAIPSKARNMVRKAEKNGVIIKKLDKREYIEDFIGLYNSTMNRNEASEYYYFTKEYYNNLIEKLEERLDLWGAFYDSQMISATLIMKQNQFIHYHLSGANTAYMGLGTNNLLLFEIAKSYAQLNYKYFHLGGGARDINDNLYKFKKSLSNEEPLPFYIGKKIHDLNSYNELAKQNKSTNERYFPIYRGYMNEKK